MSILTKRTNVLPQSNRRISNEEMVIEEMGQIGTQFDGFSPSRHRQRDVAALKGVEMLPDSYEISVQDLQAALKRQNVTLQAGDAVVINTGWGKLWVKGQSVVYENGSRYWC